MIHIEQQVRAAYFAKFSFPVLVRKAGDKYEKSPLIQGATSGDARNWPSIIKGYPYNYRHLDWNQLSLRTAFGFVPLAANMVVVDADNEDSVRLMDFLTTKVWEANGGEEVPYVNTGRGKHYYFKATDSLLEAEGGALKKGMNNWLTPDLVPVDWLLESRCEHLHLDYRAGANFFLITPWSRSIDDSKRWTPSENFPLVDIPLSDLVPDRWRDLVLSRLPPVPDELVELLSAAYRKAERKTTFVTGVGRPEDDDSGDDEVARRVKLGWLAEHLPKLVSQRGGSLPLDDRRTWINVATALKAYGAPISLFRSICWPDMTEREIERQWKSFNPQTNRTRIGTVIKLVKDHLNIEVSWGQKSADRDAELVEEGRESSTEEVRRAVKALLANWTLPILGDLDPIPLELLPKELKRKVRGREVFHLIPLTYPVLMKLYGYEVFFETHVKKLIALRRGSEGRVQGVTHLENIETELRYILKRNKLSGNPKEIIRYEARNRERSLVREWLDSIAPTPDDSVFRKLSNSVVLAPNAGKEQERLKDVYLKKWLMQCIAVNYLEEFEQATGLKFQQRGILIFQGNQGIGKTTFFMQVLPNIETYGLPALANLTYKEGLVLGLDKDSFIRATTTWVAEIGEAEQTLGRRDREALKAFYTSAIDEVRYPYAEHATITHRRTVFVGSVNVDKFLSDDTGNERIWVLNVGAFNRSLLGEVREGRAKLWGWAKYEFFRLLREDPLHVIWLDDHERVMRDRINQRSEIENVWVDAIREKFSPIQPTEEGGIWLRTSEIHHALVGAEKTVGEVASMPNAQRARRDIGSALKRLGFSSAHRNTGTFYYVLPVPATGNGNRKWPDGGIDDEED